MNGLTAHLQVGENEWVAAEKATAPRIRFFISNPGLLKTAFSNYIARGKEPQAGAESIVQLMGDEEGKFDHAMQWEHEEGRCVLCRGDSCTEQDRYLACQAMENHARLRSGRSERVYRVRNAGPMTTIGDG
jgi:hypothetical protein